MKKVIAVLVFLVLAIGIGNFLLGPTSFNGILEEGLKQTPDLNLNFPQINSNVLIKGFIRAAIFFGIIWIVLFVLIRISTRLGGITKEQRIKNEDVKEVIFRGTERIIYEVGLSFIGASGLTGMVLLILGETIVSIFFLLIFTLIGISGLTTIPREERWVVEVFENPVSILGPGIAFILPVLGKCDENKNQVPLGQNQRRILEGKDGAPLRMDFEDGAAFVSEAFFRFQIEGGDKWLSEPTPGNEAKVRQSVYQIIYKGPGGAPGSVDQVIQIVEASISSFLKRSTTREAESVLADLLAALFQKRENLKDKKELTEEEENFLEQTKKVKEQLDKFSIEEQGVSIEDYDEPEDVVNARIEKQASELDSEAAQFEALEKARELIGPVIAMLAEVTGLKQEKIREQIREDEEVQEKMTEYIKELRELDISAQTGSLSEERIKIEGAESGLTGIIAALKAGLK